MFAIEPYFNVLQDSENVHSTYNPSIDSFIEREAVNGTFLQTSRFLSYHGKEKFEDASFYIHKDGMKAAVFPGARCCFEDKNIFVSHPGSTFGGPIFSKNFYSPSRVLEILKTADSYFKANYKQVILKPTAALFCSEPTAALEYAFQQFGYTSHLELSAYTPLSPLSDPLENFSPDRRRRLRKAMNHSFIFRPLETTSDFETFYHFLCLSKAKYNSQPSHSLEELFLLRNQKIPKEIHFYGLFSTNHSNAEYLAGVMFFCFQNLRGENFFHLQYVADNPNFKNLDVTSMIYYEILKYAVQKKAKAFSWGISTENGGQYLNESLFRFKESFGAKACLNAFYTKDF